MPAVEGAAGCDWSAVQAIGESSRKARTAVARLRMARLEHIGILAIIKARIGHRAQLDNYFELSRQAKPSGPDLRQTDSTPYKTVRRASSKVQTLVSNRQRDCVAYHQRQGYKHVSHWIRLKCRNFARNVVWPLSVLTLSPVVGARTSRPRMRPARR